MKLIVTTSTFPNSDSDPVPDFVLEQIKALSRLDPELEISVLTPHHAYTNQKFADTLTKKTHTEHRYHYIPFHSLEKLCGRGILPAIKEYPMRSLLVPFFLLAQYRSLMKLCREKNPDLIYAHWFVPQGLVAFLVSKRLNIPYMFTTHSSDVQVLNRIPFAKTILSKCLLHAKRYTAVSDGTANKMKSFFSKNNWERTHQHKLSIIPMGSDRPALECSMQERHQMLSHYNIPTDKSIILAMGRLVEKKGFAFLIQAFSLLPLHLRNKYHLVIAGEGQLKENLFQTATRFDILNQITFPGFVFGKSKDCLFHCASIVAIPSITDSNGHTEGLPVVFMEAIATDNLVIATPATGVDAYLHVGNGFMVAEKDSIALANIIMKIDSLPTPDRNKIATQAMKLSHFFSWDNIGSRHLDVLKLAFKNS